MNLSVSRIDLIYIYPTLHPTKATCTYFSSVHGAFLNIDHKPNHKTNLNKFISIEFLSMFSERNRIKVEISNNKIHTKFFKYLEIKQYRTK